MTLKLTAASFLNGVRSSGLVEADPLENVVREMRAAGSDFNDSRAIAEELIKRDLVTSWQADKLLQGRHKGFFLGRYRLMRLLGTGQMSAVYLGRHIYMDHLVAIKVLPADK
ncbi:MAG: serine/threonine protein kinase, partial [Planctomycetaceae bacterium]|nr:serine/threonine protein kinase [Planctomycetaceae bacterium]